MGEHLLCKQGVVGSIPSRSTNFGCSPAGVPVVQEPAQESISKRNSRCLLLVS